MTKCSNGQLGRQRKALQSMASKAWQGRQGRASNDRQKRKEKFTLFSDHKRSLLMRQPGAHAMTRPNTYAKVH